MYYSFAFEIFFSQRAFENVEFKQANLANASTCEKVFTDDDGGFDYVFHLASETKYGQTNEVRNNHVT